MIRTLLNRLIFIGFGILVLSYAFHDKLKFFVHTKFSTTITCTGYALVAIGILALGFLRKRNLVQYCDTVGGDCLHGNHPWYRYTILLLPFLIVLFVTPQPLSSRMVAARGITTEIILNKKNPVQFGYKTENYSLIDWIRLINNNPEPQGVVGKEVSVEGMLYHNSEDQNDTYSIVNFLIICCIADAQPVGLPVTFNSQEIHIKKNTWVHIDGTMQETGAGNDRTIGIQIQKMQVIPTPREPYVY